MSPLRRAVAGLMIAACLLAASAAPAAADTSSCPGPALTQPFTSWGDFGYYAIVPGQQPGSFGGAGWTLSDGASVVNDDAHSGGPVLDLPSGATAVSPTFCVTSNYPFARALIRDVQGSEGVAFSVSYAGTSTWYRPQYTSQLNGSGTDWSLSGQLAMNPSSEPGRQYVRVTLTAGGTSSDFRVYDLYVDPYNRGG